MTLLFSPERYRAVAKAFWMVSRRGWPPASPSITYRIVASFFLSRIDTLVDKQLDELAAQGQTAAKTLRGKAAIANACLRLRDLRGDRRIRRWEALAARGARPQRLLWASTSTKDPSYSPVKYVEELIAPDTVNTMPHRDYRCLPTARATRSCGWSGTWRTPRDARESFERLGVDLDAAAETLEREGVAKFIEPFDKLQGWLEEKRKTR